MLAEKEKISYKEDLFKFLIKRFPDRVKEISGFGWIREIVEKFSKVLSGEGLVGRSDLEILISEDDTKKMTSLSRVQEKLLGIDRYLVKFKELPEGWEKLVNHETIDQAEGDSKLALVLKSIIDSLDFYSSAFSPIGEKMVSCEGKYASLSLISEALGYPDNTIPSFYTKLLEPKNALLWLEFETLARILGAKKEPTLSLKEELSGDLEDICMEMAPLLRRKNLGIQDVVNLLQMSFNEESDTYPITLEDFSNGLLSELLNIMRTIDDLGWEVVYYDDYIRIQ